METNKVIAYSLLAQIRNSGNFINSSVEIFVPIVKYALYKHITQTGVYKGASIIEISTWINKYFGLEFPSVVLEKILLKIGSDYPFMHLLYSQLLVCQRVCLQNTVCLICK